LIDRSVALAQEKTRQELELESTAGKKNVYRVAKKMTKSRQDVVGVNCVKDAMEKCCLKMIISPGKMILAVLEL